MALISQSGNVAVNALGDAPGPALSHGDRERQPGGAVGAADYLELLAGERRRWRSVALYLEDDGGPRLCDGLAACADAGVRVVVLKVGSSPAGARAAAAHSAALAGDQRVFRVADRGGGRGLGGGRPRAARAREGIAVPRRDPARATAWRS